MLALDLGQLERCFRLLALQLGHKHGFLCLCLLGCGLGLLLFLLRHLGLIRVAHAGLRTNALCDFLAVRQIHGFHGQIKKHHADLRRHAPDHIHELLGCGLTHRCAPVGFTDDEVGFGACNVVLRQAVVHLHEVGAAAIICDAETLFVC